MNDQGKFVSTEEIWKSLAHVKDPEIPVLSVIDMGIIREIREENGGYLVRITPTFSGCPAMHVIEENVQTCIKDLGVKHVRVEVKLSPPWTSDWLSETAREALKEFGIAPPMRHKQHIDLSFDQACCPYCDSINTEQKNAFGPTLCRSIFYCNDCQQPFEKFKAL